MELAQRLRNAKRCPIPLNQERIEAIKTLLENGYNKKAITIIFGLSYDEVKQIKQQKVAA
ncbi:helix-turn-helix domain-containing protein [Vibrio mediterranei]